MTGSVTVPGSKSLTQRALLCAALADGRTVLRGALRSDDVRVMADGLRTLGIDVLDDAQRDVLEVRGCGGHLPADAAELDAGDAGTAMRFLTALLCLGRGRYRIDGSPRMRQRPIGALVDALRELGAGVGYDAAPGYPPLTFAAQGLSGGQVRVDAPVSSQFVSALLMVAPYAAGDVFIEIGGGLPSRPYVDLTLHVMRDMGVEVLEADARRFIVPAWQRYRGRELAIEPDASSAGYFFAAAAVTGGRVRVAGLTRRSPQGDARFADVLERLGCAVIEGADFLEVAGPAAGGLAGGSFDLNDMPDMVQTLAVVALFARGPTEIRNVANLRVKETDRLRALATELRRVGALVEERDDGLVIVPPARLAAAEIETYNDHRMAMSFAVAGLAGPELVIRGAGCVSKSFPDFFERLARLVEPEN